MDAAWEAADSTLEKWRKTVMHPCVGCVSEMTARCAASRPRLDLENVPTITPRGLLRLYCYYVGSPKHSLIDRLARLTGVKTKGMNERLEEQRSDHPFLLR